jgi:hypothetical protein
MCTKIPGPLVWAGQKIGAAGAAAAAMIFFVLPVMERGPTGRVTREERLFFPESNEPARPAAAGPQRVRGGRAITSMMARVAGRGASAALLSG